MKKTILFNVLLLTCLNIFAQKKWTGLGNDGLWSNQLNWSDQQLPTDADSVVLDNTNLAGSYIVMLPSSFASVKYLTINPATGNKIELDLPNENILATAFEVVGQGYGLTINEGGVLKNSSGATSGYGLVISDSLRINNRGTYIHNTKRSNANIVKMLSRAPGTEKGVFVFDVPGTAGYTLSVAGRTFGTLLLSANDAGKARTYSATSSSVVTVRGDLILSRNVSYSINFTKDMVVEGDLVQEGGTFNLATKANYNSVKIKGDVTQNAGAVITQSSGVATLELCGANAQHLSMMGEIQNAIAMKVNNDNGIFLDAPLRLPFELNILKGIITATNESLLSIENTGYINVSDSLKNYVNGSIKKEGLSAEDFVFPVGENSGQPVKVIGATGDITVSYKNNATANVGAEKLAPVRLLATTGYWTIAGNGATNAGVKFRYDNQIPDAENKDILMAAFENGQWVSKSTQPGVSVNGLFMSDPISLTSEPKVLTFGTLNVITSLPVKIISRSIQHEDDRIAISWRVSEDEVPERFEIEGSADGISFTKVQDIACLPNVYVYSCRVQYDSRLKYFRIKAIESDSKVTIDKTMVVADEIDAATVVVCSSPNSITTRLQAPQSGNIQLAIYSMSGAVVEKQNYLLQKGENRISIDTNKFSAGTYLLTIDGLHFPHKVKTFIKP